MRKIKVLFVNGGLMDCGGISSFIINYLSYFDFEKFEVDIAVHGNQIGSRDKEIERFDCNIYHLPIKSQSYHKWKGEVLKLLKLKKYDIIHANADAGNGPILKIAKKANVPIRISHSHNTQMLTNNKIRIMLNNIQKKQILKYATNFFACSQMAGEWLYKNNKFEIIYNAIDYEKYKFNSEIRIEKRNELNLSDEETVVGHVGRFDNQKNHMFILELAKRQKKIKFLLIGDGHLRDKIEKNIKKNHLNNIILLGEKNNVENYLNAMDFFILPSLFEGLGISVIEAQVNGLYCVVSNNVPKECKITKNICFCDINDINLWINEMEILKNKTRKMIDISNLDDKYNLKAQSKRLQDKYISLINNI